MEGKIEKGEGVHHDGRVVLHRVAGSSGLPLAVLLGSDQGWMQSLQLDRTLKLRGKHHKIRRMLPSRDLLKAERPSPASPESDS